MKDLTTYEEHLNEGKGFAVSVKSKKDLIKAVNKLPDTIKSIKVPADTRYHGGKMIEVKPDKKNWKKEVEKIINNALKGKDGKAMDSFNIASYTMSAGPTDAYFIQYSSDDTRQFAKDMRSGKHGRLD